MLSREAPAVGAAEDEAVLFKGLQGIPEAGVVDAQLLAQCGSGERLAGAAQLGAHGLAQRGRCGIVVLDEESEGLAVASDEAQ